MPATKAQCDAKEEDMIINESEEDNDVADILKLDARKWNSENVSTYLDSISIAKKNAQIPELLSISNFTPTRVEHNPLVKCAFIHPISKICTEEIPLYFMNLTSVAQYREKAKRAFADHTAKQELERIARSIDRVEEYEKEEKPFKLQKRSMFGPRYTQSVNPRSAFEALVRMMRDETQFSCNLKLDPDEIDRDFLQTFNLYDYASPKSVSDGTLLNKLAGNLVGESDKFAKAQSSIFVKPVALHIWFETSKARGLKGVLLGWYEGDVTDVEKDPYGIPIPDENGIHLKHSPFELNAEASILCAVLSNEKQPDADFVVHDSRIVLALGKVSVCKGITNTTHAEIKS